jgi:hypothetical protein
MKKSVSMVLSACCIILMLASGCADVTAKQKVGDFGTAFGATADEQKAIDWFKATYGDPTTNNDKPARFVEPMITSGLSDKNLPKDKVTTFPVSGGSVYFFVIYDNFKKGDPIEVSWTYLENGKVVTTVKQQAGGDFGRFIVEFQKPDTGWGKGKQRITVTGDGATASVDFVIGDALQTTPLPYNPAGGQGSTGTTGQQGVTTAVTTTTGSVVTTAIITTVTTTQTGTTTIPTTVIGTICDTDKTLCNGKCVDLNRAHDNCGACGNVCTFPHAYGYCESGKCIPDGCEPPWAKCDNNPASGCEVNLFSDVKNCGSCDSTCDAPNTVHTECIDGHCIIMQCNPDRGNCDNNPANGCEEDLSISMTNCGMCQHLCPGGQYCDQGRCTNTN